MHYVTGPHDLCFRFAEDKKSFDQARMQCESEGGTLAKDQRGEVYTFVRHHIEANPLKAPVHRGLFGEISIFTPWGHGWYVGASKNGNWRWLDGMYFCKFFLIDHVRYPCGQIVSFVFFDCHFLSSGKPVLDHWIRGTPNNWGGHENCLQQMAGAQGWNDVPCDMQLRYICQKAINNPCASLHCGNGKCVADHGKPICVCSAGWKGANCDQKIIQDPCAASRVHCQNGKCIASGGKAVCICDAGWTGESCEIRAVVDHCAAHPCQNGGQCFSNSGGYVCHCVGNFKGKNCETSCRFKVTDSGMPEKVDAVILVDGSDSVNAEDPGNFGKSLQFVINLVEKFNIGAGKARLEVTQFSHKLAEAIDFDDSTHMTKAALRAKIANMHFLGGGTATDKALNAAYRAFQTQGRRGSDVAKYLVVLTDGISNGSEQIPDIVSKMKALGVKIVAVGVGGAVDPAELRLIAGGNVFTVGSFDQLDSSLISKMVQHICD